MDTFFDFILDTTKDKFLASQAIVFSHEDYNPYSDDLNVMEDLLEEGKYEAVVGYSSVNILLSFKARMYKNYALTKIGDENEAKAELIFSHKILEGIGLTGDGTPEAPYQVTRISDEFDFLIYLDENYASQSLVTVKDRICDVITTHSGKDIYFDITKAYLRMKELMDSGKMKLPFEDEEVIKREKKWWEFWK